MEGKTNKELLQLVLEQTKINAQQHLTFAGKVSTFMNEQLLFNNDQKIFNSRMINLLESDEKTKQKGVIEQVSINTKDINQMKTTDKVNKRVMLATGVGAGTLGSKFVAWIINLLN